MHLVRYSTLSLYKNGHETLWQKSKCKSYRQNAIKTRFMVHALITLLMIKQHNLNRLKNNSNYNHWVLELFVVTLILTKGNKVTTSSENCSYLVSYPYPWLGSHCCLIIRRLFKKKFILSRRDAIRWPFTDDTLLSANKNHFLLICLQINAEIHNIMHLLHITANECTKLRN